MAKSNSEALINFTGLKVISTQADENRLIFSMTGPIKYHRFKLSNPERVVFDIENVEHIKTFNNPNIKNTVIKKIRTAMQKNHRLRIVLDMSSEVDVNSFILLPVANKKYRLVIDLIKNKNINHKIVSSKNKMNLAVKSSKKHLSHKPKINTHSSKIVIAAKTQRRNLRDVIIVIDPGHGGKDPGAIGRKKTREKTIVLAIAKVLQQIINQQPGFKAVLTRRGDYYLGLRQRLAIARKYKADMFIAVHADAYKHNRAQGASVFALSRRGATTEAAHWLAAKENKSELMGGVNLSDYKGNLIRSVLINLQQSATIRSSLQIGQNLIQSLHQIAKLHHGHVEQAAFVVLKSPDIPSLLVETGFLSNHNEELKLRNSHYRHQLAVALMKGIKNYFTHRPPRGTWLVEMKNHPQRTNTHYIVERGDTLSGIAHHFHVSITQIKKDNHLKSDHLRVGQKLFLS